MSFDLTTLFTSAVIYLLVLFLVAYATDRRWLPAWIARHPATYVLSLGVYTTTWSYYGSVGFAQHEGLNFLAIYLGLTLAFILAPVILMPILRLTRNYQLTSLADLFAFRFNSQLAGILVTVLTLAGSLPYIALQIRAVAESTTVLSHESSPAVLAFWFCVLVTIFAIIFGARHVSPREKHEGLVTAIAFESLVKLTVLLLVAGVAVYQAFGGLPQLGQWLQAHPEAVEAYYQPAETGPWAGLLFLAFAASFLLPRQFHMLFTENLEPRNLISASWGLPAFLALLALAIPPLLWAGTALQPGGVADYYALSISSLTGSVPLTVLAYLGGISAASAMIVVSTLALSSMSLNHLVLPFVRPGPAQDLYFALRWARRFLIAAIIAAGYGFFLTLQRTESLVGWGLISFLAIAQLFPGVMAVLFWPRATRLGFIAGLSIGALIWVVTTLLPPVSSTAVNWPGLAHAAVVGTNGYGPATFWSVSLNALVMITVSLLTRPDQREREAAAACREQSAPIPRGFLEVGSPSQFVEKLSSVMGPRAARAEVDRAMADLHFSWTETRPEQLHRLRDQIERNLSGMMGPVLARMIVDERLQTDPLTRDALVQNVRLIEERLENSRTRLKGMAAELDRLRRYHRQVIEDLPIGVCAISSGGQLVRWNPAIARVTGIPVADAIGRTLEDIPAPWGPLFREFLGGPALHRHKQAIEAGEQLRWYSLHKAMVEDPARANQNDTVLLVEDITDVQMLERELAHSERLASIGRLAAGVAHEIGNPVTGIACLAQELREDASPELLQQSIEEILSQTQRITNIVQSLVSYAHGGTSEQPTAEPVEAREAAEEAWRLVKLSRRARSMDFHNGFQPNLRVLADSQQLIQVFVNLFSNAADACGGNGQIKLNAEIDEQWAELRVADNGPGIPESIRERVMEPFFTTKPAGAGTGLGLALVYNIVKDHGGQIGIESGGDDGTTVRIRLRTAHGGRAKQRVG